MKHLSIQKTFTPEKQEKDYKKWSKYISHQNKHNALSDHAKVLEMMKNNFTN